jgi:hypothetical protein
MPVRKDRRRLGVVAQTATHPFREVSIGNLIGTAASLNHLRPILESKGQLIGLREQHIENPKVGGC